MPRTARNQIVTENLPLVWYLASGFTSHSGLVPRDELSSAGSLALVMAADSYEAERGVPFSAYARQRILGAFKDEMRANDWASRGIRKRAKNTVGARDNLSRSLGRTPTVDEIASELGVDAPAVLEGLADASRVVTSINDDPLAEMPSVEGLLPDELAEIDEARELVRIAVDALPDRMRRIIRGVYFEDKTVKSLADELGVSHAAVSQQRAQAIRLLREALSQHFGTGDEPIATTVETEKVSAKAKEAYFGRLATKGRRFARSLFKQPVGA